MTKFEDIYNHATDIANCMYGSIEEKKKMRDTILKTCLIFTTNYNNSQEFRKEAISYLDVINKYR